MFEHVFIRVIRAIRGYRLSLHQSARIVKKVLALFLAAAGLLALAAGNDTNAPALLGTWNSIEVGGRDMGDRILRMQYIFQTNGAFSVSARMKDGEQMNYSGRFTVVTNKLRLSIPELGSNDLPYSVTNGILQIRDPQLDSWVKFKRQPEASFPKRPVRATR